MIFSTKNKELAVFGKTLTETHGKIVDLFEAFERGGIKGKDGIIETFFSNSKNKSILSPDLLSQFEHFKKKFNSSSLSAEALAEEIGSVNSSIIDYAKTCKNGEMTTAGFKKSLEGMSFSVQAGQAVLKSLSAIGNMAAMWLVSKGIELAVTAFGNYIHQAKRLSRIQMTNFIMRNPIITTL